MILRPASLEDVPALATLGRESFCAAFEHLYDPADLASFLAEAYAEDAVAAEVTSAECLYQLAEIDGNVAGYCKLRRPSKFAGHSFAANPVELGQLYTDPARTGQGIGAALMDWAMEEAAAGGHDSILLSVYSGNHGAQRFYERYGFSKIADITFRVGEQIDDEYLFEKRLLGE